MLNAIVLSSSNNGNFYQIHGENYDTLKYVWTGKFELWNHYIIMPMPCEYERWLYKCLRWTIKNVALIEQCYLCTTKLNISITNCTTWWIESLEKVAKKKLFTNSAIVIIVPPKLDFWQVNLFLEVRSFSDYVN